MYIANKTSTWVESENEKPKNHVIHFRTGWYLRFIGTPTLLPCVKVPEKIPTFCRLGDLSYGLVIDFLNINAPMRQTTPVSRYAYFYTLR